MKTVGQRAEHLGGGVEADPLGVTAAVNRRIAAAQFHRASLVTSAAVRPTTNADSGYVDTYQLPTSRSIRGCGRVLSV